MGQIIVTEPDLVMAQTVPDGGWADPAASGVTVAVVTTPGGGLRVQVGASTRVSRVMLRWRHTIPGGALILGDAWERSYGELQWRCMQPERVLPWSVLWHDQASGTTSGWGVEVRSGAFAAWTLDPAGVSLWLDLRSGGSPVRPGDRLITAAVVRSVTGDKSPFAVQGELMALLCSDSLPVGPLVGANNWYYAYGRNFDTAAVVRDARTVADLVGDHPVRPFGVVDDGWTMQGTADGRLASGGPWDAGRPVEFPDMPGVAAAIVAQGVRPGIWFRPLLYRTEPPTGSLGPRDGAFALDPSSPATLETVFADVSRIREWGFELIKHDFSTYDVFGQWGPTMAAGPGKDGWSLADPTVTSAEAFVGLYRTTRAAAGSSIVLGCNVIGHLAAGLVEAQRTGDDTSGKQWGRTRRVGVNTLAFRLAQHRRFFTLDADCVPSTHQTPWNRNRQFLDLIARSGTALFVSVDPTTRTDAVDADLSAALRLSLDGGDPSGLEPIDWLTSTCPALWRSGADEIRYSWLEDWGADPFEQFASA
jgi:alpha-galactosidase